MLLVCVLDTDLATVPCYYFSTNNSRDNAFLLGYNTSCTDTDSVNSTSSICILNGKATNQCSSIHHSSNIATACLVLLTLYRLCSWPPGSLLVYLSLSLSPLRLLAQPETLICWLGSDKPGCVTNTLRTRAGSEPKGKQTICQRGLTFCVAESVY